MRVLGRSIGFLTTLVVAIGLYAPLPADITDEVVRRYNDKFGAGEKPAGKAPPKTAQPAPKPVPQPPPGKK